MPSLFANTRDLLVMGIVLGSLPFCLMFPFFGGLMWTWIAFMNPHRLTWGYARYFLPPAYLIAVPTLLGFALSRERKRLPLNYGTYAILALWALMSLSTLSAINPTDGIPAWQDRTKMLLMALVITAVTQTRERLRWLFLVTALSIGFYGFKGGIFALTTGGQFLVLGPWKTFIEDNNAMALALNMTLPMLYYLAKDVPQRSLALFLRVTFGLSIFAVISTRSRGGLLGLLTVVTLLFFKSGRKVTAALIVTMGTIVVLTFAPTEWGERMETIETYDQDASAVSRLNAWTLAWRLALARPLLGWGPQAMENKQLYTRYYPDSPSRNDVHSSYFQLLSETGFSGFFVWLSLLGWGFASLQRVGRRVRGSPTLEWISAYAEMLQISLAAYAVSGMFLEMAYFDLIYHVFGGAIIVNGMVSQPLRTAAQPARARPFAAPHAVQVPTVART